MSNIPKMGQLPTPDRWETHRRVQATAETPLLGFLLGELLRQKVARTALNDKVLAMGYHGIWRSISVRSCNLATSGQAQQPTPPFSLLVSPSNQPPPPVRDNFLNIWHSNWPPQKCQKSLLCPDLLLQKIGTQIHLSHSPWRAWRVPYSKQLQTPPLSLARAGARRVGRRWESWALADPETTHPYCWNLSTIPAVSPKKRFQNWLVHKILRGTKELLNTPGYFQDVLTITSFQPGTPSLPWCQPGSTPRDSASPEVLPYSARPSPWWRSAWPHC